MKTSSLAPVLLPLLPSLGPLALALPTTTAHFQHLVPRLDINDFLALVMQLFPTSIEVSALGDTLTVAEASLATTEGLTTTRNDLTDGSTCGDVVVVFARGTTETGNVGALAGPPFFDALETALKSSGKTLAVQGVNDYAADVVGFLQGGSADGSQNMADQVTSALTKCPSAAIVMSGYSQGGQVVHKAAKLLTAAQMGNVSSAVIFGDPDKGSAVASLDAAKTLVVCHTGDDICLAGDMILMPHLTYAGDADTAADFVVKNM